MNLPSLVSPSIRVLPVALVSSLLLTLSACASTPPPKEQMAVAEAAIQHATTTSTNENAAGELQLATDKLTSAKQAMARQDYAAAKTLAEQTEVDAQVAELHAQAARSRKAAVETQNAAGALNDEMNRKTPPATSQGHTNE
ncbi:MAG TPA: DUF4398 domain-containing protein [Spongiibacteraceae bacterium]|nr:DUF4398 domain-containing protein [Spongiibacteraceae bacterium]